MLLYIIRHGIPDYTTDTLTEEGRAQAEAVTLRFRGLKLDRIFSSPLGRARQTAEPTAKEHGLPVEICPFMSEAEAWKHFVYFDSEGKRRWSLEQKEKILGNAEVTESRDSFVHGLYEDDSAARKGYAELSAASDDFIEKLGFRKEGNANAYRAIGNEVGRVAAFCHGGFGLHWISYLLGFPPHVFTCALDFTHTGVSVVKFETAENGFAYPQLLQHADLSHIAKAELPYLYHNKLPL